MGKTPLAMERLQNQSRIKNNNHNNINGANNNAQRQLLKNSTRLKNSKNYGANFIRYILQTFNVMFFMSGCIIIAIALWSILWKHQYVSLLMTSVYPLISYGLLISGIFATFTAIFGCYVVWRDQRSMICCYSMLLILVFAVEFLVGAVTYVYEPQVDDELLVTLNTTFITSYGINERRTNAIDLMQQNFKCCGAERFEDWKYSTWFKMNTTNFNNSTNSSNKNITPHTIRSNMNRVVPDSCCISYSEMCGKSDHPSNIPYTGCIYQFIDETRDHLNILGAIGFGFCFVQIFGLILSCCLYFK